MKIVLTTFLLILTTSCGFQVVKQSDLTNFSIIDIVTLGDKRINYKVRNNLLSNSSKDNQQKIKLEIETKRVKTIKEKNIKNEITKYQIMIIIEVEVTNITNNKKRILIVSKSGDYSTNTQYSQTLSNEKKLVELLSNNLSEEILNELSQK